MKKSVSIIGGDLRLVYLAEMFAKDEFNVYMYGFELEDNHFMQILRKNSNIYICENLKECIDESNKIISAIPFSVDGKTVNAPYARKEIYIEEIVDIMKGKTFIAGSIKEGILRELQISNEIIDVMKIEEVAILNAVSTAEGTVKIAIEETNSTIQGSNVLILGFGRLGKILAKMFKNLDANVYCEARKIEDLAWIKAYGYNEVNLKNLQQGIKDKQIIINTVPYMILDENILKEVDKDSLIIDLASKPRRN